MGVNALSNASEYGYFAKDVAADLEVTTSTLRPSYRVAAMNRKVMNCFREI